MAFPQPVLDDMARGRAYLSSENSQLIADRIDGCDTCHCKKDNILLKRLLFSLDGDAAAGVFDSPAQGNYLSMMKIIGGTPYVQVGPIVNAGPDKSALTSAVPQTATADITQGYYPIATILWTQKSGPAATFTGQNTATLQITSFGVGYSVFEITVTDTMGNSNSDEFELEGLSTKAVIGFGYSATDPYGSENVPTLQFSKEVELGATEYELDFTDDANLQFLIIKEPVGEPVKTEWFNTEPNSGDIPGSKMRNPVVIGSFRYYISRVPFALDTEIFTITFNTI